MYSITVTQLHEIAFSLHWRAVSRFSKIPPPVTTHAAARLWTARVASCRYRWLFLLHLVQGRVVRLATRGSQEGFYDKNTHNSVTTENIIRICINFLDHKDLENHLLQLCPQVVNHYVCTIRFNFVSVDKGCRAVMIHLTGFGC